MPIYEVKVILQGLNGNILCCSYKDKNVPESFLVHLACAQYVRISRLLQGVAKKLDNFLVENRHTMLSSIDYKTDCLGNEPPEIFGFTTEEELESALIGLMEEVAEEILDQVNTEQTK